MVELAPAPDRSEAQRLTRVAWATALATTAVAVFICGELYVAVGGALKGAGMVASYASGLTMLALPCTLPMLLVVVPLAMGRQARKGVAIALAFGAGVTLTLSGYGAAVAVIGSSLGITSATKVMWFSGGAAAWLFGCSNLGLFKNRLPGLSVRVGRLGSGRASVGGAFVMGLLLGNAGLGCPCPAWYLLLTGVASSGSPLYGAQIGLAQGLGRMTPVVGLTIAAVLGLDATPAILRQQKRVETFTGAALVVLGSVIVVFFSLAHSWFEATPLHSGWNHLLAWIGGAQLSGVDAGGGPLPASLWWAPWLFATLALGPFVARWAQNRSRQRRCSGSAQPEIAAGQPVCAARGG